MVNLEQYGYRETNGVKSRRQSLGKAIQRLGYKRVYNTLSQRMKRRTDYRYNRLRADRNWVKRKAKKLGKSVT